MRAFSLFVFTCSLEALIALHNGLNFAGSPLKALPVIPPEGIITVIEGFQYRGKSPVSRFNPIGQPSKLLPRL